MDTPLHFSALRAHARPAAAHAGWNDALDHRCVRLISAGGEHVGLERMTLGSELLRHGFKEWGGIRQALNVAPAGRDGTLDAAGIAQVRAAIDAADDSCELPVVVCRDRLAP